MTNDKNKLDLGLPGLDIDLDNTETLEEFSELTQNPLTNQLATLLSKNEIKDQITAISKIDAKDFTFSIDESKTSVRLGANDQIIFDIVMSKFTSLSNQKSNPSVNLRVDDFMELRGITNEKTAYNQLHNFFDVYRIGTIKLTGEKLNKHGRSQKSISEFSVISEFRFDGLGTVKFTFTPSFAKLATSEQHILYMPKSAYKIDAKRHPHAYFINRQIYLNKRRNHAKPNKGDRLSVRSLLKNITSLPTYEQVRQGDRHSDRRIIKPFLSELSYLTELGYFEVDVISNGDTYPLESFRNLNVTWDEFEGAMLSFRNMKIPEEKLETLKNNTKKRMSENRKKKARNSTKTSNSTK